MIKEIGNLDHIAKGTIVAGYRNKVTSEFTPVLEQKNLVTYGGADIMAKLISGDSRYAINGMYFKYENTVGTPSGVTPARSHTVSSQYHTLTGTDDIDWLRVPIITNGKIAKSPVDSVNYEGNSVTFVATTASVGVVGETTEENPFTEAANSKIFAVALVAMPAVTPITGDIAFSMANLASAILAIEDSYIDIFWTISFT